LLFPFFFFRVFLPVVRLPFSLDSFLVSSACSRRRFLSKGAGEGSAAIPVVSPLAAACSNINRLTWKGLGVEGAVEGEVLAYNLLKLSIRLSGLIFFIMSDAVEKVCDFLNQIS
jgi:hypothetical protein